jgi:hypothetical protein
MNKKTIKESLQHIWEAGYSAGYEDGRAYERTRLNFKIERSHKLDPDLNEFIISMVKSEET